MKRISIALTLTCVLFVSVHAGDMHTGDAPAPAPSPTPQGMRSASGQLATSAPGDVHTGDSAQPSIEDMLNALLSVFGLVF